MGWSLRTGVSAGVTSRLAPSLPTALSEEGRERRGSPPSRSKSGEEESAEPTGNHTSGAGGSDPFSMNLLCVKVKVCIIKRPQKNQWRSHVLVCETKLFAKEVHAQELHKGAGLFMQQSLGYSLTGGLSLHKWKS